MPRPFTRAGRPSWTRSHAQEAHTRHEGKKGDTVNEFLNLDAELSLGDKTVRELTEGRAALQKAIGELQTDDKGEKRDLKSLSDEDGKRFDGLCDRLDAVDAEIRDRQDAETRNGREARAAAALATTGGQGGNYRPNLGNLGAPRAPEPAEERDIVANPDGSRYSMLRCIDRLARGERIDGYEAEISQEIEHRSGQRAQGFYVPFGLPMGNAPERRDFDTTAGAGMIPRVIQPRFIDALRNRMLLARLGANVMEDLVGTVDVPKRTSTTTGYWAAEATAITESAQAVGKITYTPTTLGAFTEVTRRMRSNVGSASVDMRVREDLIATVAHELDRAGINGSGSGAEPEGVLQNSSVDTVAIGTNGGAMTWAKLVEMETAIAANNASIDTIHYVTSPAGFGHFKTKERATGTAKFLYDNGQANGRDVFASGSIPIDLTKGSGTALTAAILGDWRMLGIGLWTGFDVLVDPHTKATSGDVRVIVLVDCDIQVELTEAFAKCVDIDPDA